MSVETDRIERDLDESRHRLNDTLNQLGRKLSPGQILDETLGLLEGQAGKFAGNLGRQVRDNPLPVLLVAGGVAWLMTSQGRAKRGPRQLEAYGPTLEQMRSSTTRLPDETDEAYEERLHLAYAQEHNLQQHANEPKEAFTRRIKEFAQRIQHATSAAGHGVGHAVAGAASGAKHVVGNAASGARHAAGSAARGLQSGSRRLGETAVGARHGAERFYDANPLAVGAIVFGLGALLGAAVPLSRAERSRLHGIADATARQGAELVERGQSKLDQAMH